MKITNNEIIKETILNELKEIKVDRNNSISFMRQFKLLKFIILNILKKFANMGRLTTDQC